MRGFDRGQFGTAPAAADWIRKRAAVTDMDSQRGQAKKAEKATRSRPAAHKPAKATSPRTPAAKPSTRSRHYRRAQHDRGAETRARLIEAGLDVFGRLGPDGATTRQIARQA